MTPAPDIHRATMAIGRLFEGLGLPYALGGAIGMGFSGVIRATRDVDLLASLPALRAQEVVDSLNREGFARHDETGAAVAVDVPSILAETRSLGHFRIWSRDGVRIEVFVPLVPLQASILDRRFAVDLDGEKLWVTTPEDLVLLKMIFHRPKDLDDVRRLLAANRDVLDVAYLRNWRERTLEPGPRRELIDLMAEMGL